MVFSVQTVTGGLSPNTMYQRWDFKQFEKIKCHMMKFQINDRRKI